ncbi:MAG: potassium/proton antiporter [Actinomycetota bacterium]
METQSGLRVAKLRAVDDGPMILVAGALMVAALAAALAAGRLRVPGLVLFLGLGMAIGSDGTGWIRFDDYELARTIGIIALGLILFEGGLMAGFGEIRPVLGASLALAFAGTVGTAVVTGFAAVVLLDLSTLEGMLVGSILAATDGAAIFGVLRGSTLRRRLARTLEGEAGFNDPVAVLLVVGFIDWIQLPDYGFVDMSLLLVRELGIGLLAGLAVGWLGVQGMRRARLGTAGVYPVGTIGIAAVAYGAAATLHGSGFLAVYLAGLVLGSATIPAKQTVRIFHQGLAWIAQVAMFLVLGLLVFPSQLDSVATEGTVLALVLACVARPAAAALSTAFAGFSAAERLVLGWAGLRGAVPVVLATFPVIEGVPHSLEFFNLVFFAVLVSTVLQGATFEPLARAMGVTTTEPALGVEERPPRTASSTAQIFTTRPWRPEDGDPAYPRAVAGIAVVHQRRTRLDEPGALVELEDGRYAFTGPVLSIGSASALQGGARRRLARSSTEAERDWWREVIGALAR